MSNPTDAQLVASAKGGDADAFGELVRRHERSIYGRGARRQSTAAPFATRRTIKADDLSHVARLISADANLARAKIEPHAPTPLHLAAAENRVDIAEALIAGGADVNAQADWGGTALDSALIYAQDPAAQAIARHVDGALPLRVVAGLGWVERVKKLLAAEPRPGQEELDGALHRAAMNGRIEVAGLLLDAGADIQAKGFMGTSPLHQAARTGQLAMAEFLVSRGADLQARDEKYHGTPADWAKEYHRAAVEAMLRRVG